MALASRDEILSFLESQRAGATPVVIPPGADAAGAEAEQFAAAQPKARGAGRAEILSFLADARAKRAQSESGPGMLSRAGAAVSDAAATAVSAAQAGAPRQVGPTADQIEAFSGSTAGKVLNHALKPYALALKGMLYRGPQEFFTYLQHAADLVGQATGTDPGRLFQSVADLTKGAGPDIDPETLVEKVAQGFGTALTGQLPQYALTQPLGVPGFAVPGVIEATHAGKDLPEIVAAGVEGALLGRGLEATAPLTRAPRVAAQAGLFGGAAAAEPRATPETIAEGAATGALFGMQGGPGQTTARQAVAEGGARLAADVVEAGRTVRGAAAGVRRAASAFGGGAPTEVLDAYGNPVPPMKAPEPSSPPQAVEPAFVQEVVRRGREAAKVRTDLPPEDRPKAGIAAATETATAERNAAVDFGGALIDTIATSRVDLTKVDLKPDDYQYKTSDKQGQTGKLKDATVFSAEAASTPPVLLRSNPETGRLEAVDGHQRVGLAKRLNAHDPVQAKILDGSQVSVEDARWLGALRNVRLNSGTAVDAARLFRERGFTADDLRREGLPMSDGFVADAMGLAQLTPGWWRRVLFEEVKPGIAAEIGRGLSPTAQDGLLELLGKQKRPPSEETLREMIRVAGASGETGHGEEAGGGGDWFKSTGASSTLVQRAQLSAKIRERLGSERAAFGSAARNAEILGEEGKVVNPEASRARSEFVRQVGIIFDRLSARRGPLADILNEGAKRVAGGESVTGVMKDLYEPIREQIKREYLGGANPEPGPEKSAAEAGGGSRPAPEGKAGGEGAGEPEVGPSKATRGFSRLDKAAEGGPRELGRAMGKDLAISRDKSRAPAERKRAADAVSHALEIARRKMFPVGEMMDAAHNAAKQWRAAQGREGDGLFLDPDNPPRDVGRRPPGRPSTIELAIEDEVRRPVKPKPIELREEDIDALAAKPPPPVFRPPGSPGSIFGPDGNMDLSKIVTLSQVAKDLARALKTYVGLGRVGHRRALGVFFPKQFYIRLKLAKDIRTLSHEIGHAIDHLVFSKGRPNAETWAPWRDELDPIATQTLRVGEKPTAEGFAEFIARYVMDPADAARVAPRFYRHFEEAMQREAPSFHDALLRAREDVRRWKGMASTAQILSNISFESKEHEGVHFEDLISNIFSDLTFVKKFVEDVVGQERRDWKFKRIPHSNIDADANPFIGATLLRGLHGKIEQFLTHGTIDWRTQETNGIGLRDALAPIQGRRKEFAAYITARRILELSRRRKPIELGPGMEKQTAEAALLELRQQDPYFPAYHKAFWELRRWQDRVLQYMVDAGVVRAGDAEHWREMNHQYVPMYAVFDPSERVISSGSHYDPAAPVGSLFNPVHKIRGGPRDRVDPIESAIKNMILFVHMAERNKIGMDMLRLANAPFGGRTGWAHEMPAPTKVAARLSQQEVEAIITKYGELVDKREVRREVHTLAEKITETVKGGPGGGGPPAEGVAKKIEDRVHEALRARGFAEGEARQYIDRLKSAAGGKPQSEGGEPFTVEKIVERMTQEVVRIDVTRQLELSLPPGGVEIWRASRYSDVEPIIPVFDRGNIKWLRMDPKLHAEVMRMDRGSLGAVVRIIGAPARLLRAGATQYNPEFAFVTNPLKDQVTAFIQSRHGYIPGKDFVIGAYNILRRTDLYREFERSGALAANLVSMDRNYLQREVKGLLEKHGKADWLVKHPLDVVRAILETTENATRLGEFRNVKRQNAGLPAREQQARAAYAAREVSVDFGRIGKHAATRLFAQTTAFWMAGLNGVSKFVRTIENDPVGAAFRIAAAITLPEIIAYLWNNDDARIAELPAWRQDLFLNFSTAPISKAVWAKMPPEEQADYSAKHKIWGLPKPYQYGLIFGTGVRMALDWARGQMSPEDFSRLTWRVLASFTTDHIPIPTAGAPAIDVLRNQSGYFGRKIVPGYLERAAPSQQYETFTSPVVRDLAGVFTDTQVEFSPMKAQYLIRTYGGGLAASLLNAADWAYSETGIIELPQRSAYRPEDTYMVRKFIARYPSADMLPLQEFYAHYDKVRQAVDTFSSKRRERPQEAVAWLERHRSLLELSAGMRKLEDGMSALSALARRTVSDKQNILSPEDRQRALDVLMFRRLKLAKIGNKIYRDRLAEGRK